VVARLSAKAKFHAMALGVCELLWIKIILKDLRIESGLMNLYCHNKSSINIAHNLVPHDHIKHIEVDKHFIKEKIESGLITIPHVKLESQLAYALIKGLSTSRFQDINGNPLTHHRNFSISR